MFIGLSLSYLPIRFFVHKQLLQA